MAKSEDEKTLQEIVMEILQPNGWEIITPELEAVIQGHG